MDVVTYALCKKLAAAAVSGIKNLTIQGTNLIIQTTDGKTMTMAFPTPADGKDGKDGVNGKDGINGKDGADGLNGQDGVSIVDVEISKDNHVICTLSDGSTIDAGKLPIPEQEPIHIQYATEDDINKLFENEGTDTPGGSNVTFATERDINNLFKEEESK